MCLEAESVKECLIDLSHSVDQRVVIGMSAAMLRESLGKPERINRTVTATLEREQWV